MEEKGNKKRIIIIVVTVIILILSVWTFWQNKTVGCTYVEIRDEMIPASFDGFKIAQISDLHNAQFGEDNAVIMEFLKNEQPDLIVLTGDLADSDHTDLDVAVSFAKQAVAIAPCYFVTGNHEGWLRGRYEELEQRLTECGVIVLHDEKVRLERDGESILLLGMDDPDYASFGGKSLESFVWYDQSIQNMDIDYAIINESVETDVSTDIENTYTILLSHRPELFDTYVDWGVDLVLSGHAHGGQFRLPLIGGLFAPNQGLFPKYDSGIYQAEDTTMFVSRGIGNSVIPVRFNDQPEVIFIGLSVQ